MNKYLRLLAIGMAILNGVGIARKSEILLVITIALGVIIIILDMYQSPTRRKMLFYSISVVLLALLWIALDQEWIKPILFI